eukprot:658483-Prymnesium_polylepis.1
MKRGAGSTLVVGCERAIARVYGRTRFLLSLSLSGDASWRVLCAHLRDADASTLALVAEQTSAHSDYVNSVAFSPDGTRRSFRGLETLLVMRQHIM